MQKGQFLRVVIGLCCDLKKIIKKLKKIEEIKIRKK